MAIRRAYDAGYPGFPCHSPRRYLEFSLSDVQVDEKDHVYESVLNVPANLQLDRDNRRRYFGTELRFRYPRWVEKCDGMITR